MIRPIDLLLRIHYCKEEAITGHNMNVSKQTGSIVSALFAMSNLTHLALDEDPTMVVFNQDKLWPYLIMMLEKGNVAPFPVMKRRRPTSSARKVESIKGWYASCDDCSEWCHYKCITTALQLHEDSYVFKSIRGRLHRYFSNFKANPMRGL